MPTQVVNLGSQLIDYFYGDSNIRTGPRESEEGDSCTWLRILWIKGRLSRAVDVQVYCTTIWCLRELAELRPKRHGSFFWVGSLVGG